MHHREDDKMGRTGEGTDFLGERKKGEKEEIFFSK
jgi:hypothetical protein